MKYIISILIVVVVSFTVGVLLTFAINHLSKNGLKKSIKVLLTIFTAFFLMLIAVIIFINDYSHAKSEANEYLKSNDKVTVNKTDFGYFFDGKGEENAIIFYPGAKIEGVAYSELLYRLAEEGIDTFLVEMPFRLAFLGANNADYVLSNYQYNNVYMMGHSLGGSIASSYAVSHNGIDGLIFLASYTSKQIPENMSVLSIYGTNDGVLNKKAYDKAKAMLPPLSQELVIEGGNHSQFAMMDLQSDDNPATITYKDQITQTLNAILAFI